jgi:transcriptional regulator with PAS, ATPase and Fis domain
VRIIAASNVDLEKSVEEGRFRQDLYFRLNVLSVSIPPLRERPEDLALLTEYFLKSFSRKMELPQPRLTPAGLRKLQDQNWPGNVRQLEKCIERSLAYWDGEGALGEDELFLDASPLSADAAALAEASRSRESLKAFLTRMERERIRSVLDQEGHHVTHAAQTLGISRQYLHRKIKELGLRQR